MARSSAHDDPPQRPAGETRTDRHRVEPATPGVTPRQRRAFISAFGGWLLDGYNAGIFGLVLGPALTELLPRSGYAASAGNIAFFGELGVAMFLFGWGCSFVWGPVADRFGRVPALMASILVYAIFTFIAGFSQANVPLMVL